MDTSNILYSSDPTEEALNVPYASLIGSINYCAVSTRPDIAFATNKCAQFTAQPGILHWEAAKRIVRYLLHTKDHSILFKADGKGISGYAHNIAVYMDADFGGDTDD